MKKLIICLIPVLLIGWHPGHPFRRDPSLRKEKEKFLGADISFLPQLEERGMKFLEDGVAKDPIEILKDHGFNYIRLRIFNEPSADSGYSPEKGFCDLEHTKEMALRIRNAHMKFLLDFHYSDTWADPGKQFKPAAWEDLNFPQMKVAIYTFTKNVLDALKAQGTPPDMVQVGNEINHGILWPDGSFSHPDTLAAFLKEAIRAVRETDPSATVMLHLACGGQNRESRNFIDQMQERHVSYDLIGESYYPQWHGTLSQLDSNLRDLATRYKKDIVVVEYSKHKKEVNDIVFNLPDQRGRGTFIWEPLNTWESIFDKEGHAKDSMMNIYSEISRKYKIGDE
jgi:arabinogalactan endo-1,4-beta-galactosidase